MVDKGRHSRQSSSERTVREYSSLASTNDMAKRRSNNFIGSYSSVTKTPFSSQSIGNVKRKPSQLQNVLPKVNNFNRGLSLGMNKKSMQAEPGRGDVLEDALEGSEVEGGSRNKKAHVTSRNRTSDICNIKVPVPSSL